ncbi:SfnB family sulfur acquisition oxidoreductase [Nocardioides jishulii]|uniref:SfnB family sulfur acquisition oxidoreductase n=1 Tax=Nocardioides jishulii TaxID=2575440 RepID=A0A4U2YHJ9_9ACTN|nr:SfnB family sulfur acquisition oxidoreductase [Nocardioides jishulii]TKI60479.1 SfnB family sulfur acquisition oxidoreductase [Nocardioides jishulii]
MTEGRVPVLDPASARAEAARLRDRFAEGASERDAQRILPHEQVRELAASGLLAITVPAAHGGADLPVEVVADVIRLISQGDPNLGQIPQSHFAYVNSLRLSAAPAQQAFFFGEVLAGKMFGNAQSELGTKHVRDYRATLLPAGEGEWVLNADKGYCTGALFADWIPVLAHLDVDGPLHVAWVERHTEGVTVVDDWDGVGQRTTASGGVRLVDVTVTEDLLTPFHATFDGRPQTYGSFAQTLHAAIDAGIARAAVTEAAAFVTTTSRPYPDAGVDRHADDPLVVHAFGELEVAVRGAEALLAEAARAVDRANADLTAETAGAASLALAAARAATTRASVEAASRLFELAGTRSALGRLNLDRHWRNARTHTLHDPAAWKIQHLGRHVLDGVLPPSHGQI